MRTSAWARRRAVLLSGLFAAALALLSSCGGSAGIAAEPVPPRPEDLGSWDRVAAFERLHQRLSAEYAFTGWKGVDWDAMRAAYLPRIKSAGSAVEYLIAVHAYLGAIPDGHVSINPAGEAGAALFNQAIGQQSGGSYGLGLVETDDGQLIAAAVAPDGPAAAAGIAAGARILSWAGHPAAAAIAAIDPAALVGAGRSATAEGRRLEQVRWLGRAPVGAAVDLTYRNPGAAGPTAVRLAAVDDGLRWAELVTFLPPPDRQAPVVSFRRLASGVGYIRLTALADLADLASYPHRIARQFAAAVASLAGQGATGLIVDLRSNVGGYDTLAATICGLFATEPSVYEIQALFDTAIGRFVDFTYDDRIGRVVDALMVEPSPQAFTGPVAALVNPRTISSGEGVAMCIDRAPRGQVVGFHGTNGSFGLAAPGIITMPDGLSVSYPIGRSLDGARRIQLDSRNGVGGVAPSVRVPLNQANALAYAAGTDVELGAAEKLLASR